MCICDSVNLDAPCGIMAPNIFSMAFLWRLGGLVRRNALSPQKVKNIETSSPIATAPLAMMNAANTLSRSPENTTIEECEVDLRVGGRIRIVTEGGEEMGRYAGTRWPLEGTFTRIEEPHGLTYEATSWTEGEEGATIEHVNEVDLTTQGDHTVVRLRIHVTRIGSGVKARLAAYGMRWGYDAQLDKLDALLASPRREP